MTRPKAAIVLVLCLFAGLTGCNKTEVPSGTDEAPKVRVAHPLQQDVTDYVDFTGRTDAVETIGIRARVTGFIVGHPFGEGQEVKKDQVLYEIDDEPYQAQYDQQKAQVDLANESLNLAQKTYARTFDTFQRGAGTEQEVDETKAAVAEAKARVRAAEANLKIYDLNKKFCKVTSPIDGLVSRYYYVRGNLINQDQTLLATVVSIDPMYAYFDMDEPTQLRISEAIRQGKIKLGAEGTKALPKIAATTVAFLGSPSGPGALLAATMLVPGRTGPDIPVFMGLQTEEGYPHRGSINFINNVFNPSTGSIQARGRFDNPQLENQTRLLRAGMFVRIRLQIGDKHPAVLVDSRVIGSQQGTKFVYVLDKDNTALSRRIRTGSIQDDGLTVIEAPRFKLTKTSLQALRDGGITAETAAKLERLKDTQYGTQDAFLAALAGALAQDELDRSKDRIFHEGIDDGLLPDDWVIVTGLKQVRPHTKVEPQWWTMPTISNRGNPIQKDEK